MSSQKPRIFIGSSTEGKAVAQALQVNLNKVARATVWDQAFPLSTTTIDSLLARFRESDFAVFVFSPDDVTRMRGAEYAVARDNVVFEAGLFMGMHAKEAGFILAPSTSASEVHFPTDLLGLTTATYDADWAKTSPIEAVGAASTLVVETIKNSEWSRLGVDVVPRSTQGDSKLTYPLKLHLNVQNNQSFPVLIESISFTFGTGIRPAPNARLMSGGAAYRPEFLIGKTTEGKDHYVRKWIVEPGHSVLSWVPIDPMLGQPVLDEALKKKMAGVWRYRCHWIRDRVSVRDYEHAF